MSTLKADTIQSTSGGAATLTKQEAGKAHWVFNQIGVSVDSSFNVSSITDDSTGRYFPNITNAMDATTYGYAGVTARTTVSNLSGVSGNFMRSTSQYECNTTNNSDIKSDQESCASTWGDLA